MYIIFAYFFSFLHCLQNDVKGMLKYCVEFEDREAVVVFPYHSLKIIVAFVVKLFLL